jgi:hypothetical protein
MWRTKADKSKLMVTLANMAQANKDFATQPQLSWAKVLNIYYCAWLSMMALSSDRFHTHYEMTWAVLSVCSFTILYNTFAQVYRHMASVVYDVDTGSYTTGVPLPRDVSADIISLALAGVKQGVIKYTSPAKLALLAKGKYTVICTSVSLIGILCDCYSAAARKTRVHHEPHCTDVVCCTMLNGLCYCNTTGGNDKKGLLGASSSHSIAPFAVPPKVAAGIHLATSIAMTLSFAGTCLQ